MWSRSWRSRNQSEDVGQFGTFFILFPFVLSLQFAITRSSPIKFVYTLFSCFLGHFGRVVHKNQFVKACKKDAVCKIEVRYATVRPEMHTVRDF